MFIFNNNYHRLHKIHNYVCMKTAVVFVNSNSAMNIILRIVLDVMIRMRKTVLGLCIQITFGIKLYARMLLKKKYNTCLMNSATTSYTILITTRILEAYTK